MAVKINETILFFKLHLCSQSDWVHNIPLQSEFKHYTACKYNTCLEYNPTTNVPITIMILVTQWLQQHFMCTKNKRIITYFARRQLDQTIRQLDDCRETVPVALENVGKGLCLQPVPVEGKIGHGRILREVRQLTRADKSLVPPQVLPQLARRSETKQR